MKKRTHHVFVSILPQKEILEQLAKQSRKLKGLKVLSVIAVGCAIGTAIENYKLEEEICQLTVRMDKLERGEEE